MLLINKYAAISVALAMLNLVQSYHVYQFSATATNCAADYKLSSYSAQ